jgi:hypothetical protein
MLRKRLPDEFDSKFFRVGCSEGNCDSPLDEPRKRIVSDCLMEKSARKEIDFEPLTPKIR